MKKLFVAIRQYDHETAKAILEKKPDLISCVAKQPPKKDDGQSLLQVAIKCNNFAMQHHLLDLGADVNFMEAEECANIWIAPVVHDAIRSAIRHSRFFPRNFSGEGFRQENSQESAEESYTILKRMLALGANPLSFDCNRQSTLGQSGIMVACETVLERTPHYDRTAKEFEDSNYQYTEESREDFTKVFDLLREYAPDMVLFQEKDYIQGEMPNLEVSRRTFNGLPNNPIILSLVKGISLEEGIKQGMENYFSE
ncbi:MAG: ankyrin repeat domain-containing protein [Eubacteriales bacterium]